MQMDPPCYSSIARRYVDVTPADTFVSPQKLVGTLVDLPSPSMHREGQWFLMEFHICPSVLIFCHYAQRDDKVMY